MVTICSKRLVLNDITKYAVLPPVAIVVAIFLIHLFFELAIRDITSISLLHDFLLDLCYYDDTLLFTVYRSNLDLLSWILTGNCEYDLTAFWKSGTIEISTN